MPGFQSDLIFSGFNSEYRLLIHESIFDLIWYGEGRWSWDDLYTMPVFLRRYWLKRVNAKIKDDIDRAETYARKTKSNRPSNTTKRSR